MVSKLTSFHNELENVDYKVEDEGGLVVIKGTAGEMCSTKLEKVLKTYTMVDGRALGEKNFKIKDRFI